MYTELVLAVELSRDTPDTVLQTLQYMVSTGNAEDLRPAALPDHPLFTVSGRWEFMLQSSSYYFAGQPGATLRWDHISESNFLTVRCNLKNYSDEIRHFLTWIAPHVRARGYCGTIQYEEDDEPTLLYALAADGGESYRETPSRFHEARITKLDRVPVEAHA